MELVLFPNQMYNTNVFKDLKLSKITFIEHYMYYGYRSPIKLQLNTLRIVFMHFLHKRYIEYLKNSGYNVEHITLSQTLSIKNRVYKSDIVYDPCDKALYKYIESKTVKDNPSFILGTDEIKSLSGGMKHASFFNHMKSRLNILDGVKNMDILNRERYKKDIKQTNPFKKKYTSEYDWEEAIEYIMSKFNNNPGPSDWDTLKKTYLIYLPTNHVEVDDWFKTFVETRLNEYGKYQDIIIDNNPILNHSFISPYLNNGMILPNDIIRKVLEQTHVPIQSREGFVRQVVGWREYSRYYYLKVPKTIFSLNHFGFKKTKVPRAYYTGKTGNSVINSTIKHAFEYGYINHIQRLMIMANYMTLSKLHPDVIYKWMYEFSLDSYEWVMIFNCYSMGAWSDKGYATRKPYISSSNYVSKMSNYKRDGVWDKDWDELYNNFLKSEKDKLRGTIFFRKNM